MLPPNQTSPPIPSLAFSKDTTVCNDEVSKDFITPKKEKEAHFFQCKIQNTINVFDDKILEGFITPKKEKEVHFFKYKIQRTSDDEQHKLKPPSSPLQVKILVGTKAKIEQWLREYGPGSSCLWVQVENSSQNTWRNFLSWNLKFAYRLHSEQSLFFLPVLNGTNMEISPPKVPHKNGWNLRKPPIFNKSVDLKHSNFVLESRSKSPITENSSNVYSNSTKEDMSPSMDRSLGLPKRENFAGFIMPEKAYEQLIVMISPKGIIQEYQEFFKRAMSNSNFLDFDFQLLDLHMWLKHHPFAAFLEETDIIVVIRGDGISGLQWALLRFDFNKGVVRYTKGDDLNELELISANKSHNQVFPDQVKWWGKNVILRGDKAQEKQSRKSAYKLNWKVWIPIANGDLSKSPLTELLFDALGSEENLSDLETNSLKSLFDSQQFGEPTQGSYHSSKANKDLLTISPLGRNKEMSWKEQCALAHLQKSSLELKGRGLCVLLSLLLESNNALATSSMMHTSTKDSCLASFDSNHHTNSSRALVELHACRKGTKSNSREDLKKSNIIVVEELGDLNLEREGGTKLMESHTSGIGQESKFSLMQPKIEEIVGKLGEAMTYKLELAKGGADSQTQRVLNSEDFERKLCRLQEKKCQCGDFMPNNDNYEVNNGVEPFCITNWLKYGFLEILLERLMVGSEGRQGTSDHANLERGGSLNIEAEVVSKACLRVLEVIPKEGSSQLAKLLVVLLQQTYQDILKLNLNIKQHSEVGLQERSNDHKGINTSCMIGEEVAQAKKPPSTSKLQEIFEKLLKLCKFLYLLMSTSPLVGGTFATLGGLDLVLELYFYLVKRFPINLRLGVLSSAMGGSKGLETSLPREVKESQNLTPKVLPCILPSASICKVAQACLMDHCMTPKQVRIDFAWPPTNEWKKLCPIKHLFIDSHFNINERPHHDEPCDNPLQGPLQWVPEALEEIDMNVKKFCDSTPTIFTRKLDHDCPRSDSSPVMSSSSRNGWSKSSPCTVTSDIMGDSHVEGSAHSNLLEQKRPFVPKLSLNTLKSFTPRFGPSMTVLKEARVSDNRIGEPNLSPSQSIPRASTLKFEILTTVYNVKLELLKMMVLLFSNCSLSLEKSRSKLLQKFQMEKEDQLVLQFLPDIIGSFSSIIPEYILERNKEMLFQVISLVDKCKTFEGSNEYSMGEAPYLSCAHGSNQGSLFSNDPKKLIDSLLLEVAERLRILVCHLAQVLAKSKNLKDGAVGTNSQRLVTIGALGYFDPLLENSTISSGHLLSLWVDIGLLLRVLSDFILLWPGGGSVQRVLNSCGKQIENVLSLVAEYSSKTSWSLAKILIMEHLLKLFTICIKSTILKKRPQFHTWSEIDTFFWNLLFMNDLHWNCVKSFATWMVMKSCQGCLTNLYKCYQKLLCEPLKIYYNMLGELVNFKSASNNVACTIHEVDMSKRSIFSFLRVSILMMKKRLRCQGQSTEPCPTLCMNRLLFLLEFLMNPVEGLLINIIRSPIPCIKLDETQRDMEALNLVNFANSQKSKKENYMPNNPRLEPILQANNEGLYLNYMEEQCKKCANPSCATKFAQKFTSSMKRESLSLLSEIFSLKSFDHHDEQANLCVNPRAQNPFLFWKYVNPFLEIIFYLFLKVYNKKVVSNDLWLISNSPLAQCNSGLSKTSMHSGQQSSGSMVTDDISSRLEIALFENDQDDIFCSSCSHGDEVSSIICIAYGQVLRALAHNQTSDVSQMFQHMRVMKFLVQQIGLEYEVSQVATPRGVEPPMGPTKTPFSLKAQDKFDGRNFEDKISEVDLYMSGERSKAQVPYDKVEDIDLQRANVHVDAKVRNEFNTTNFGVTRNHQCNMSSGKMESIFPLSKGCPRSVRDLQDSRASMDQANFRAHQIMLESSMKNHTYHFGFHSTRDVNFTMFKKFQSEDHFHHSSFHDLRLTNLQKEAILCKALPYDLLLTDLQKEVFFCKALPSERQYPNIMCKKHNLGEYEMPRKDVLSQRNGQGLNKSNKSLEESKKDAVRPSTTRGKYSSMLDGTTKSNNLIKFSNILDDTQNPQHPLIDEDISKILTNTTLTTVRYTGRFFDLNEEVDRELDQEDFSDSQMFLQEEEKSKQTKHFDKAGNLYEEGNMQNDGSKLAPLAFVNSSKANSSHSSYSELSLELKLGISPKQKCSRPTIPRLNLSKSVRKGGPTINPDTSIDFEFVPSIMPSVDSKFRVNALLELQKELQKEVASFNEDNNNIGTGVSYDFKRMQRRLYRHDSLHVILLELYVSLMLTPQGTLETCYCDRYPMQNRKLNAPFFLSYHLNHTSNIYLMPCLTKRMKDINPAAFRILKLTWRTLFNPKIYTNRVRIARGAVSQVYTANVKRIYVKSKTMVEGLVVLKIVDVPKGPYDPCKFVDVYSEVEILEKFLGEPAVCQILDYGVDTESFILVLKHYKCNLHTWRKGHSENSNNNTFSSTTQRVGEKEKFGLERLPLYLEVYSAVLQAVKVLEIKNVVHYDLKCDNILLEPVDPLCSESKFWTPNWPPIDASKSLPFRICIADFGQSKASAYLGGECTVRNRGTEYVKSPEMLKLLSTHSQRDSDFNLRNTDEGVGKAVDVWSLGCLLYELLTGEYLFYDEDWLQFFMRVTLPSEELITKEKAAQLDNFGPVVDLLKFILVRDPLQRPSLDDVAICVEQLQLKLEAQAFANTSDAKEILARTQILSEEEFDSSPDDTSLDEQILSSKIEILPNRVEHIKDDMNSLGCLRKFICSCHCIRGE